MMRVELTGIGPVMACGQGVAALVSALEKGTAPDDYRVAAQGLDEFVPARQSRRMDNFTRMTVLAACLAIKDAAVVGDPDFKNETGIVFGSALGPQESSFAFLDGIIDGGDPCASSFLFTNSVHSTAAAQVALALGVRGPMRAVTAFGHTAGAAFSSAISWIRSGAARRVLVVLTEEVSALQRYSLARKGARGPIDPFGPGCTVVPGEGSVAFMLEGGARDGYGSVSQMEPNLGVAEALQRAQGCDLLFSAAAGRADEFAAYDRLGAGKTPRAAYSPLYGSSFAGMGFELAVAALSLRKQFVFPIPEADGDGEERVGLPASGAAGLRRVAVAAAAAPGRIAYMELDR
jgi:3-oxoacyl-[acyl-carrier-protein] synthase II